jgi:hypothetical protein
LEAATTGRVDVLRELLDGGANIGFTDQVCQRVVILAMTRFEYALA